MMVSFPMHICVTPPQWVKLFQASCRMFCRDIISYNFSITLMDQSFHWTVKWDITCFFHYIHVWPISISEQTKLDITMRSLQYFTPPGEVWEIAGISKAPMGPSEGDGYWERSLVGKKHKHGMLTGQAETEAHENKEFTIENLNSIKKDFP